MTSAFGHDTNTLTLNMTSPTPTNFLRETRPVQRTPHQENMKRPKRASFSRRKRTIAIGASALFLLLLVVVLSDAKDGKAAYDNAMRGKTALLSGQEALHAQDFDVASQKLEEANGAFTASQDALHGIGATRYIPFASRQVKAVNYILEAGIQLTSATARFTAVGTKAMDVIEASDTVSFANISTEQKAEVLRVLYESPPELQGASAQIALAEQAIDNIPTYGLLPPIREVADLLREQFPKVQNAITAAVPAIQTLPYIVGYPEQRTYLFLLQNNTELRPTGGFIGTYGLLKVQNAEIQFFETDNIYNLDNVARNFLQITPPKPISSYLGSTQWLMRDSNWDPDFPTSAEKAIWFYHEETQTQEPIDGVIAITPVFIQSLLEITGDITIRNITFTSENLVTTLQRIVEQDFTAYGLDDFSRKQIIGELADELMNRIFALPQTEWGKLWGVFTKNVEQKHILLYSTEERIEQLIKEEEWGGEIQTADGDYLMVVDANLASLKSDPLVYRSHTYSVSKDSEKGLIATVNITYNNKNDLTFFTTRYHTYVRVYAPEGSELVSVDGAEDDVDVTTEHGKTVFGTYKTIEYQDQETLTLTYALPARLENMAENGEYSLLVQKQPGTAAYDLSVTFDVGEKIGVFDPQIEGTLQGDNRVEFMSTLDHDRWYVIGLDS